jgi:hypothetical protein
MTEASMQTNVGAIDRIMRLIVGVLLIAYAIPVGFPSTGWNWIGWIGVIPILTAAFSRCPLYSALGISTCSVRSAHGVAG